MSSDQVQGGSGPALSAHSKDSSVPGPTPASAATGGDASGSAHSPDGNGAPDGSAEPGGNAGPGSRAPGNARATAEWIGNTVSDAAGQARQGLTAGVNRAASDLPALMRDQPFMVLAATGLACFAIGFLLGRR